LDIERGEVRPRSSGEAEPNPYPLGVTEPTPRGSGEAECIPQPSGEAETSLQPLGEAELSRRRQTERRPALCPRVRRGWPKGIGQDGGQPFALGRGGAGPKASGETEAGPLPSGEAGLAQRRRARRRPALCPRGPLPSGEAGLVQRRRARWNLTFVIRARNAAAPSSVLKFLTFDGSWFHLLGYPGIRSPTPP